MARFFPIAVLLALSAPVAAADYKPGTVGYLYEDCRKALEENTKISDVLETYCGSFSEGYFYGAMASNWSMPEIAQDDPCHVDKTREFARIDKRFCGNFPVLDPKKTTTGDALNAATNVVTRWIAFEKKSRKSDPLRRGTLREINNLIRPGAFCNDLKNSYPAEEIPFTINPALTKMNFSDYMKTKNGLTISSKYERCKKDIETAAGDPAKFLSTKCGAEISGYISGLHSTQNLQKGREEPARECKKEIDRLYKNLDFTKTMCVSYDTNPLWVAGIFVKKYPELKVSGKEIDSIGAITIYRGFLCADKNSGQ